MPVVQTGGSRGESWPQINPREKFRLPVIIFPFGGALARRAEGARASEMTRSSQRDADGEARGLIEVSTFKGGERCPAPSATLFIYLRHIQLWPRDRKTDCTDGRGADTTVPGIRDAICMQIPPRRDSTRGRIRTMTNRECMRERGTDSGHPLGESRRFRVLSPSTSTFLRHLLHLRVLLPRCPLSPALLHPWIASFASLTTQLFVLRTVTLAKLQRAAIVGLSLPTVEIILPLSLSR